MRLNSVKDICNALWNIEQTYELLDFQINEVKIWQYTRIEIYYKIGEILGLLEKPKNSKDKSINKLLKPLLYLKSSISKNPFFADESQLLIIDHERIKKYGNKYIDIYTYPLLQQLNSSNVKYKILEKSYNGIHYKTDNYNKRIYYDLISIINSVYKIRYFTNINKVFDVSIIKFIEGLENELGKRLDIKINLRKIFKKSYVEFKSRYDIYRILLNKIKPNKIVCLVSYGEFGEFIKAAKEKNIEVIELQHGVVNKYHMGYSYPYYNGSLDYFPDKFLTWGKYWKDQINWPIDKSNVIPIGFPYLMSQLDCYNINKKNIVTIISQDALGSKIASKVYSLIESLENYTIYFKLHPGEYNNYKNIEKLETLSKNENFKLLFDIDLYSILSKSKFVVGVFSTAIFEAVAFDCIPVLLNLPGIEYMEPLINEYKVPVLDSNTRISVYEDYDIKRLKKYVWGSFENFNIQYIL